MPGNAGPPEWVNLLLEGTTVSNMKRLYDARMHLVEDDEMLVPVTKDKKGVFRFRAWRKKQANPVVLVNSVAGGYPTIWATKRLAYLAWSIYLDYAPPGWVFCTCDVPEVKDGNGAERWAFYELEWFSLAGNPEKNKYRGHVTSAKAAEMTRDEFLYWTGLEDIEV